MSVRRVLILSVVLAGSQGPVAPPPPPPPLPLRIGAMIPSTGEGLIEGVVRRLETGAPLPDARVNLTASSARAGSTKRYRVFEE
jgi:hypothetical protein